MAGEGCPVCGMRCTGHPSHAWPKKYPSLPGGVDPLANQLAGIDFVYAPHAVTDPDLERVVFGAGDPVPMADAIRFGLVDAPQAPEAADPPGGRRRRPRGRDTAKHGPVETAAHRLEDDR